MEGIRRELFPILGQKSYFNTCSIGPQATLVRDVAEKYLEQWNQLGGVAWVVDEGWNAYVERARELFASLIGAKAENIAYSFGNSVSISTVTSIFNLDKPSTMLFNELDFPAIPTHLMGLEGRGVRTKVVPSDDGLTVDASEYDSFIDDTTKLITACEVSSNTGSRIDRKVLQEVSEKHAVPLFLDTYQSTGVIPMDVSRENIDFVASGCLKWLIGGFGMSFLYVSDRILETFDPSSIGWMGVDEPFLDLFDKLRTELHRPDSAKKFQYGTPYPIGAMTAAAGMEIVHDIGINNIYNYNMRMTQSIIDRARDQNYEIQTPVEKAERGSIVNIEIENAMNVVSRLQAEGFVLDMRSNGIRLAPHFFNNQEDIDILFDHIKMVQ